jgi:hypothetical protein
MTDFYPEGNTPRPTDSQERSLHKINSLLGGVVVGPIQTAAPSTFPGIIVGGTLTRPANTTAYASGDLVANSTTAGSVVLQTFPGVTLADNGIVEIQGARLLKSGTGVTGASFAIHLFTAAPASFSNGDNGAFLCPSANYVGVIDITVDRAFTNGAFGSGIPRRGTPALIRIPTGNALHYALEARGAYTPISDETFIPTLEIYRW